MLKVTLKFSILLLVGCANGQPGTDISIYDQQLNIVTEARIDSAYRAIQLHCDSMLNYVVPELADSIVKSSVKK